MMGRSGSIFFVGLLSIILVAGCSKGKKDESGPGAEGNQGIAAPNQEGAGNQGKRESIIGKTTAVVVDAKKALMDPNNVIVENKVTGNDPVSTSLTAYVSLRSQVSTLGMQQVIQHHKILNDKFPTYAEFMEIMKQHQIEFTQLYPYQMYGYDEVTGGIVVIENKADKAERYRKAGIPVE